MANIFAQFTKPVRSVQDYGNDMDAAEQNRLTLQSGRMKAQQDQQGFADENTFRGLAQQYGTDQNALYKAAMAAGLVGKAQGIQKSMSEQAKAAADLAASGATTDKTLTETQAAKLTQHNNLLVNVQSPEDGAAWVQLGVQNGSIKPENAPMLLQTFQRTAPQQFGDTINKLALGMKDYIEKNKPTYTTQGLGDRSQIVATPGLGGAPSVVSSSQINQSPDSVARSDDAAKSRAQSAAQFGETKKFQREQFDYAKQKDATKPAPGAAKTGPMSVTMQKELLEADDTVQSAGNVVNTLKSALKINDKAYSGYFAKGRAQVVSNLGGTDSADATIDIDNMMTGQALESLKVVFGGMPTEGERKILLEMQASADKTPDQRKAIMTRAIAAAERRAQYAGSKAKAIRGGTYLTEGAEPVPGDAPKPAGAMSPEDTQAMDWANKNPNDPRSKQIKQRLGGG